MSKFAYSSSFIPGSTDEGPFVRMIETAVGSTPNPGQMALLRRLLMECHTMSLQEMRAKVDRAEDAPALKLQSAERSARYEAQKARLAGLDLTGPYECSHALIDNACQQYEDNTLRYIKLKLLTSRDQELNGEKKDAAIEDDVKISKGKLVVQKGKAEVSSDNSTDLRVRMALTRRSLRAARALGD
jgi:hypothetical protein